MRSSPTDTASPASALGRRVVPMRASMRLTGRVLQLFGGRGAYAVTLDLGADCGRAGRSTARRDADGRWTIRSGDLTCRQADGRPLGEAEGAFLMCGFTRGLAELPIGHIVEAFRWFERQLAACGPAGLLSEELDGLQRQLRGNVPQGFVHALLLERSQRLGATAP